jgi:ABC-type phosphate transport system auxiliary subunit
MLVIDPHGFSSLQSENFHLKSQVHALTMEVNSLRQTVQAQDNLVRNQQRDIQILTDRAQILTQQMNGLLLDKSSANHALETLTLYQKSLHEELKLTDSERLKLQSDQGELLRQARRDDHFYSRENCFEPSEILLSSCDTKTNAFAGQHSGSRE